MGTAGSPVDSYTIKYHVLSCPWCSSLCLAVAFKRFEVGIWSRGRVPGRARAIAGPAMMTPPPPRSGPAPRPERCTRGDPQPLDRPRSARSSTRTEHAPPFTSSMSTRESASARPPVSSRATRCARPCRPTSRAAATSPRARPQQHSASGRDNEGRDVSARDIAPGDPKQRERSGAGVGRRVRCRDRCRACSRRTRRRPHGSMFMGPQGSRR